MGRKRNGKRKRKEGRRMKRGDGGLLRVEGKGKGDGRGVERKGGGIGS